MLPLIRVEGYIRKDGNSPFADWFDSLDAQAANKVNTYLTRIEGGNTSSLKPIKGAFQEVRIDWGAGYRVYVGKRWHKINYSFWWRNKTTPTKRY